jgi:hypothetical protein
MTTQKNSRRRIPPLVCIDDCRREYREFLDRLFERYQPSGIEQERVVETIAEKQWEVRRMHAAQERMWHREGMISDVKAVVLQWREIESALFSIVLAERRLAVMREQNPPPDPPQPAQAGPRLVKPPIAA